MKLPIGNTFRNKYPHRAKCKQLSENVASIHEMLYFSALCTQWQFYRIFYTQNNNHGHLKAQAVYTVVQINLLRFKFFVETCRATRFPIFRPITMFNVALPGCTVHFDQLKFCKAGAPSAPEILKFSRLIYKTSVNGLGFRF